MKEENKINWDEIEKAGKGKILWLDKYELLTIFVSEQQDTNIFTLIDLPKNWRVRDVFYSIERRSFGFLIISNEFSATPRGMELPSLKSDKIKKFIVSLEDTNSNKT